MVPLVISAYCQWILLSGNGVCRCVKLTDNGLLYLTHSCQSLEELYLYAIPGFVVSTLLSILADITTVWVILCRSNNVQKSFSLIFVEPLYWSSVFRIEVWFVGTWELCSFTVRAFQEFSHFWKLQLLDLCGAQVTDETFTHLLTCLGTVQ